MRRILVVEDDPTLRDVYQTIISSQPYLCETAVNGKDALLKCVKTEYDLILLDLMMPVMSGVDFLINYPDIDKMKSKIIILSNLSSGKELERAHELGIEKSIVKSNISPKDLITIIRYDLESAHR